jgi:hypothetical protein
MSTFRVTFVVTLFVATLSGCSSHLAGPNIDLISPPRPGSTFSYVRYNTSNGSKQDSTEHTLLATVLDDANSYLGLENVTSTGEKSEGGDSIVARIAYHDNADVSYLVDFTKGGTVGGILPDPQWVRIPFGGKTTITQTLLDTSVSTPQGGETVKFVATTTYDGDESVEIDGQRTAIWNGSMTIQAHYTSSNGGYTVESSTKVQFAPELGVWYHVEETVTDPFTGNSNGWTKTMTSYQTE